jgi:hypothetical protein
MREEDDEGGTFAVPGGESHESPDTLSPDEGGNDPHEPPSEPKQPAPEKP